MFTLDILWSIPEKNDITISVNNISTKINKRHLVGHMLAHFNQTMLSSSAKSAAIRTLKKIDKNN